ncbi:MAG: class I SAM-dependent methyltransferase [Candidatus Nealsonbacteria bacterium]|nr:class I SAM-dependent methyltransferase [Candidatus Nealsonbacteria bacterium]
MILNPTQHDDPIARRDNLLRMAEPYRIPARSVDLFTSLHWFNGSVIRHDGRLLLAYRKGRRQATVWLQPLADDLSPQGEPCQVRLPAHPWSAIGKEDPRLFPFRDQLWLSYSAYAHPNHASIMLAQIDADGQVLEHIVPKLAGRQPREKNWVFFDHGGTLHAVYHASPHRVLRINGLRAELLPPAGDALVGCQWGEARGGAPPVLVGDQWYHWFHTTTWLPNNNSVYLLGLYTFDATPPFRMRRVCPFPLYSVNGPRPDRGTPFCVFPCGAMFENGRWLLSLGIWDDRVRLLEIAAAQVEQRLVPVNSPDARMPQMITSNTETDTFWHDWSELPGWCDRAKAGWLTAAVAQLAEQNPDFVGLEIGVFGGRSLTPIAAALGQHPQALLVGIDPWSAPVAIDGLEGTEHEAFWGRQEMLDDAFVRCRQFIERYGLSRSCLLLPVTSARATELITGPIDYLHIDGNHSDGAAHDATFWVPRVRPGGLIVIDDTDGKKWPRVQEALAVVRQSADLVHDGGDWQAWRKRGA